MGAKFHWATARIGHCRCEPGLAIANVDDVAYSSVDTRRATGAKIARLRRRATYSRRRPLVAEDDPHRGAAFCCS